MLRLQMISVITSCNQRQSIEYLTRHFEANLQDLLTVCPDQGSVLDWSEGLGPVLYLLASLLWL